MQIYEDKKMVTYIVLSLLCMSFGSTGCKISVSSSTRPKISFSHGHHKVEQVVNQKYSKELFKENHCCMLFELFCCSILLHQGSNTSYLIVSGLFSLLFC